MTYRVIITPTAKLRVREQAEYIARDQAAPEIAAKWLARVFDKVGSLAEMPHRFAIATEDAWCDYEVRRLVVGQFVIFFTIVDETRSVWVIHARHGSQLSEPEDFPRDPRSLE